MRSHPFRSLTTAVALALVMSIGLTTASQASPSPCEPDVTVDNTDPLTTTIGVSVECEVDVAFRRIVTATAAGVEVARLDTSVALAADSAASTELTLPKVQVCIEDPDAGTETCIP